MKKYTITQCLLLLVLLGIVPRAADAVTVRIDAYIDGSSHLLIQGDTVWWRHGTFSAPGQWPYGPVLAPLPTIINGYDWYPDWSGVGSGTYGFTPCAPSPPVTCESDRVVGLVPLLPAISQAVTLNVITGRGPTTVENPTALNDYTMSVYFDDIMIGGADWYRIDLTYETAVVPLPAPAWLLGSALGLLGWVRRATGAVGAQRSH
ncbi:MAG: hypothetical protein R3F24_06660 [Gammaproteobacteria bacterium]